VKNAALRAAEAKLFLQQPFNGHLDLSQGVAAFSSTHEMRHFGSGSCVLTICGDGNVLVIPPPPCLDRLDVAVSALSVEAVCRLEQAQTFIIPPSKYLDAGEDGMVTCVSSSSDRIRLGVTACRHRDPTSTCAYIVEYGPINTKASWGEQIDRVERKKHEIQDEQRAKKGMAFSSGASVVQISCGSSFSVALLSDGSLWSWGSCRFGCLGHGPSVENLAKPKKISCSSVRFAFLSSGTNHVGCVSSTFELFMWGCNQQGQLGLEREKDSVSDKLWPFSKDKEAIPAKVTSPSKVLVSLTGQGVLGIHQLACGDAHSAILTSTGAVLCS
jgi:hypothetical protein